MKMYFYKTSLSTTAVALRDFKKISLAQTPANNNEKKSFERYWSYRFNKKKCTSDRGKRIESQ